MTIGSLYFAQYTVDSGLTVPSHVSCWALVGATTHSWDAAPDLTANAWADLMASTYNDYCLGENFMLVANEDYPMIAVEDRFLVVPPDSGFTVP